MFDLISQNNRFHADMQNSKFYRNIPFTFSRIKLHALNVFYMCLNFKTVFIAGNLKKKKDFLF